MKVVVTGGRDYDDRRQIFRALNHYHETRGITWIVHGGAKNCDSICGLWAERNGVPVHVEEPAWDDISAPGAVIRYHSDGRPYNAAAGPMRNQTMLDDYDPDTCIYFPGGTGTAHMMGIAEKWGCEMLSGTDLE